MVLVAVAMSETIFFFNVARNMILERDFFIILKHRHLIFFTVLNALLIEHYVQKKVMTECRKVYAIFTTIDFKN